MAIGALQLVAAIYLMFVIVRDLSKERRSTSCFFGMLVATINHLFLIFRYDPRSYRLLVVYSHVSFIVLYKKQNDTNNWGGGTCDHIFLEVPYGIFLSDRYQKNNSLFFEQFLPSINVLKNS